MSRVTSCGPAVLSLYSRTEKSVYLLVSVYQRGLIVGVRDRISTRFRRQKRTGDTVAFGMSGRGHDFNSWMVVIEGKARSSQCSFNLYSFVRLDLELRVLVLLTYVSVGSLIPVISVERCHHLHR